jgi:hypothetical protein
MAKKKQNTSVITRVGKKTSIGNSQRTKHHNKGGGNDPKTGHVNGSTRSKFYKKKYRGQGR